MRNFENLSVILKLASYFVAQVQKFEIRLHLPVNEMNL